MGLLFCDFNPALKNFLNCYGSRLTSVDSYV